MVVETIKIFTEYFTKGAEKFAANSRRINKSIDENTNRFSKLSKEKKTDEKNTELNAIAQMNFGQVLGLSQQRAADFMKSQKKMTNATGAAAMGIRKATHGMRGFKMEMLGVMFFGQSMTRIFGSLMKKSFEWTGVTEILSTALGILFLPIAMKVLDFALWFLDVVSELNEDQKLWIGYIALIGAGLGILITVIGTLALGIGSMILAFGFLFGGNFFNKIKLAGGLFKWLGASITGPILAAIAIIVAIFVGMYLAWKENFLGMKTVVEVFIGGIKDIFSGLIKIFKGIFLILKGIFTGEWGTIWEGVKMIFFGAVQSIFGIIKSLVSGIGAIFIGIVKIVWEIIKLILAPFIWFYDYLVGNSLIPDLVNAIIEWFKKLPGKIWDAVKGIGKKVASAFTNMIPDWMLNIFRGGIKIAGNLAGLLGFKDGGIVPGKLGNPVPIMAHAGERVIPANRAINQGDGAGNNFNITVNASVSNDYDVRRLAEQLSRYLSTKYEGQTMRRGI